MPLLVLICCLSNSTKLRKQMLFPAVHRSNHLNQLNLPICCSLTDRNHYNKTDRYGFFLVTTIHASVEINLDFFYKEIHAK